MGADGYATQGLDRLELIRFLQVAQTITVHHGALAYLANTGTNTGPPVLSQTLGASVAS